MHCQNLIKTLYVLVVVYISWQGIPPKMFTMVNFLIQIMISVWQMLETKSLLWYSYLIDFNLVFHDNLTQKFIQG